MKVIVLSFMGKIIWKFKMKNGKITDVSSAKQALESKPDDEGGSSCIMYNLMV